MGTAFVGLLGFSTQRGKVLKGAKMFQLFSLPLCAFASKFYPHPSQGGGQSLKTAVKTASSSA
jgi:hypothetical protein